MQADVHHYQTTETPLANTLTLHQLQAKILFQIYQAFSPYTEQSDTMSWLKTVAHQLRCFLRACNI